MTNGNERLDRIERIPDGSAKYIEDVNKSLERVGRRLDEMAARQHCHDEAFERRDATMEMIQERVLGACRR